MRPEPGQTAKKPRSRVNFTHPQTWFHRQSARQQKILQITLDNASAERLVRNAG